jgi:hypothetical protein
VSADAHRPSSQRIAVEDDDEQSMVFYRAMPDTVVSNDGTLEETVAAVSRYLDQQAALRDEAILPGERGRQLRQLIAALARHGIPCAVFAGLAVVLYFRLPFAAGASRPASWRR